LNFVGDTRAAGYTLSFNKLVIGHLKTTAFQKTLAPCCV
jgi:hypothetical protein